jgi:glycosyltransferase involved in cell wall biosynthesis
MSATASQLSLAVFMTRGMSLEAWEQAGLLEREMALYERLKRKGADITFVTYGGAKELAYQKRFFGMTICCNRFGLPPRLYETLLPFLHWPSLRRTGVFKSNQTDGADVACRAAALLGRPFVARCGYLLSDFARRQHGDGSAKHRWALELERKVFTQAQAIVVTTDEMAFEIEAHLPGLKALPCVIPNFVDTDMFQPDGTQREMGRLLFIGRLEEQKNLPILFESLRGLPAPFHLALIGRGSLQAQLQQDFPDLANRVSWLGTLAHKDLPGQLNGSSLFVLPSAYEGHPKALIEAMAAGSPIIGADSPGIRDVIEHGRTGWLVAAEPDAIRRAILHLSANPTLCAELGANARQFALANYSLEAIAMKEAALLRQTAEGQSPMSSGPRP